MLQKIVVISFLILSISSCTPNFITDSSLSPLHKGMSRSEVHKFVDIKAVDKFSINYKNQEYDVIVFDIITGRVVNVSAQSTSERIELNHFYFLYHQDKLLYWGMRNDFSKSEDPFIAEFSPEIYKHVVKD